MKKLLSIAALAFVLGLSACNKDDDEPINTTQPLTKTEVKTQVNSFNSSVSQDLEDFSSSEGLKAITDLSDIAELDDPFGRKTTDKNKLRTYLRKKGETFRKILDNQTTAGRTKEGFNFEANTGVYEWNADFEQFERTGDSDIIKIKFPTEGSTSNDGELRLNAYTEVEYYDAEWDEYSYMPSLLDAELLVDGAQVASLDLSATYEDGFPVTMDVTATLVPFTATLSFDVAANDKNTLAVSLKKNNEALFSTSVEVLYSNSDKGEDDVKTVSGFVQLKNIKMEGSIDVEGMDVEEGVEIDYNEFVDLKIFIDSKLAGKVVFKTDIEDGDEVTNAYIEYNDGTTEKLEDLLQPVIDDLEDLEEDING